MSQRAGLWNKPQLGKSATIVFENAFGQELTVSSGQSSTKYWGIDGKGGSLAVRGRHPQLVGGADRSCGHGVDQNSVVEIESKEIRCLQIRHLSSYLFGTNSFHSIVLVLPI